MPDIDQSLKFLRSHCDYTGAGLEHVDTLEDEIIRLKEYLTSIVNVVGMQLSYKQIDIYAIRAMAEAGLEDDENETK